MGDLTKWKDTSHTPELRVYMVDPHNLDIIRGELTGVEKVSMTYGYNSDTKVSGSLSTIADNYIPGSWLRIVADGEELATMGVASMTTKEAAEGGEEKDYTLQSVLWMIDGDIAYHMYTIAGGTRYSTALKKLCQINSAVKEVAFLPGWRDGAFSQAVVYERTESYRKIYADICSRANDQLDVDGHGRITIAPYYAPEAKTPAWDLDEDDPRGIILSPGYDDADASGEAYSRTVVVATKSGDSGDQTIVASTDAPSTSPISDPFRGWTRTQVHDVQDLNPFTQAQAQRMADQYAPEDRNRGLTRECTCLYFPVKGGDVIRWKKYGQADRKYLVTTADLDLSQWTVKLSMRRI